MKKILLFLFLAFAAGSCSTDSETSEVYYELIPIYRCEMPYRFTAGETYELNMLFKKPTTCHTYKGIYFEGEGNTKTIAIQSMVYKNSNCQTIDYSAAAAPETQSETYNFTPTDPGSVYVFKIYTGKNDAGENTYYEVTVPVDN